MFDTLPLKLGNIGKRHFVKGFRIGGFQTDDSRNGWKSRKRNTRRNRGRAILVDTGALRRSIKITRANRRMVAIGTNLKYAEFNNDGTDKLPQREFLGDSKVLEKKLKRKIEREINKILLK